MSLTNEVHEGSMASALIGIVFAVMLVGSDKYVTSMPTFGADVCCIGGMVAPVTS